MQLLDSSCFYTRKQDSSRQMSRKGKDGIFPREGEVRVCSPDMQLEHILTIQIRLTGEVDDSFLGLGEKGPPAPP
jgi:hypothetical protein